MPKNNWKSQTLEQLENDIWGEPVYNSHLVKRAYELRKVPLNKFSIEDLRIMIGQHFGLDYLIPLAIEQLELNPLAEGDYYPGDLMQMVLTLDKTFWEKNPDYYKKVDEIVEKNRSLLEEENIKLETFKAKK